MNDVAVGNDGLYAIMLINYNEQNDEEIREFLETFGDVANVRRLPNSQTTFVRYKEQAHAQKCLARLLENPRYRARVPDRKSNKDSRDNRNGGMGHAEIPNEGSNRMDSSPSLTTVENVMCLEEMCLKPVIDTIIVVISNLPLNIYISELFELCSEGEPINIMLRTTGSKDFFQTRYAIVEVKTEKFAQILISDLDGTYLDSHRLVAARLPDIMKNEKCDRRENNTPSRRVTKN